MTPSCFIHTFKRRKPFSVLLLKRYIPERIGMRMAARMMRRLTIILSFQPFPGLLPELLIIRNEQVMEKKQLGRRTQLKVWSIW